jgi:omega-6 fatty acid desaturase (delta-12 desaturase)
LRGLWQLANTLIPYGAIWYLMYLCLSVSIWLALPLAVIAGGFLVRIFIIFHDCGHGSFLKSQRANDILGFLTGVLTFTPYRHWRWEHALHHSTSGDLDRRGVGDLWTITVQEYLEATRWKRFGYRLARNPVILFLIAPLALFLLKYRIPHSKAPPRERRSVHLTNLATVTLAAGLISIFGLKAYALVQLTMLVVAGAAGVWLFYVQHQFEGAYWERGDQWDYTAAALQGSSFYKLPKILQWFSGNIGFHHVHHLSPRIPNYHLEKCHTSEPLFRSVRPITFLSAFKCLSYRLWDEQQRRLVGYRHLREIRRRERNAKALSNTFTSIPMA